MPFTIAATLMHPPAADRLEVMPFDAMGAPEVAAMMDGSFDAYPNLQAMAELAMTGTPMLDVELGLDLLLDGLERLCPAPEGRRPA